MRHNLQVLWVNTGSFPTNMIKLESIWNWTKEKFPTVFMGFNLSPILLVGLGHTIRTVAAIQRGDPNPTITLDRNFLSKTLRKSAKFNPHIIHPHDSTSVPSWGLFLYE
jgi:hypothetical protein